MWPLRAVAVQWPEIIPENLFLPQTSKENKTKSKNLLLPSSLYKYVYTYIHNIVCRYILYVVYISIHIYCFLSVFGRFFNQCQSITEPDHEEEMIWSTGDYYLWPQSCQGCVNFKSFPMRGKSWCWEGWISSHRWFGALPSTSLDNHSPKLHWSPYISGPLHWS